MITLQTLILSSLMFLLMPTTMNAESNNESILYLNSDTSIVLPYFDTSSVANSNIDAIVLSLYVLDKTPETPSRVQITINPVDLNNNSIGDGLSTFVDVEKDSYVNLRLPKELFEQSIQTPRRFLVNLVSDNQRLVLKGPDPIGTTLDPKLIVEHQDLDQNENPDQPRIIKNTYNNFNITGDYVERDKITNNFTDDNFPWWLKYLIFPLLVLILGGYVLYRLGWVG